MNFVQNRTVQSVLCLLAIGMATVATLQARSAGSRFQAPTTSVATINWLEATKTIDEWIARRTELDQARAAFDAERKSRADALTEKQSALEVYPEGSEIYNREADKLRMEIVQNKAWSDFQNELLQRRELRAQIEIYLKINEAVTEVAKRDGWNLVIWDDSEALLPRANQIEAGPESISRRRVFYADEQVTDITEDVAQFMNNNYKSGG
ncbi:MAG: OmpH family outer membrane protein [Phycisphaerales bacterium]